MPIEDYPNLRRLTTDEAREIGIKGGKASGKTRARARRIRECMAVILDSPEPDEAMSDLLQAVGLEGNRRDALALAQIIKAIKGDTDAARFVRDTIGEKPRDELDIGGSLDRPIASLDMSKLSDDELRRLISDREGT